MGELIDDDVLNAFSVVGSPEDAGNEVLRRFGDVIDRFGLYAPYALTTRLVNRSCAHYAARPTILVFRPSQN